MNADATRRDRPAAVMASQVPYEIEIQFAQAPDARERLRKIFAILSRPKTGAED